MDKKMMTELEKIRDEMSSELERILAFWSTRAVDDRHGGFVGQIDHDGNIVAESSKGAVLNTRILWTFAAAGRFTGPVIAKEMASRAYAYLTDFFWDREYGGLYWELDAEGNPVNTRKQAYAQGFGIYAFSEYFLYTGNEDSLAYAKRLYRLLEDKFLDKPRGGYIEALDRNWNELADMRLSEKDANLPKSMNTHLHLLEPYTNLYRAWPDEQLRQSIHHLLEVFQQKIIDPETGHFRLFFEMDWACKSNIVSFGHDIEGAWLMHEAAQELDDPKFMKGVQESAIRLVDITISEGRDADGSIYYEREGDHLDTDRHWWPQAEAMVGWMDAWEITQHAAYIEHAMKTWTYIKEKMIDYTHGEWYWRVDRNGIPAPTEDKAGFWKCPYHNTRALIEMIRRIRNIPARNGSDKDATLKPNNNC
jgi:mannobiose 2-epimerase